MGEIEKLKLARELYPVGTKYYCADNGTSEFTVEDTKDFSIPEPRVIYGEVGKGCIFYKGKWAKIIESPGAYLLKRGDIVKFKVRDRSFRYKVSSNHLENTEGDNSEIFAVLGMDTEDKMNFCDTVYGYDAEYGQFPECKDEDFEALTEVVKALYDECNKANYLVSSEDW